MTTEKVFAKSDATGSDEQEIRSEWECQLAEPEDIPEAALEYLLTTGGDAQEMRSEDQANLEQLAADQADDPRRRKSDAKDVLALSEVSAEAILDNCTTTIVLAAANTDAAGGGKPPGRT